MSLSRAPLTPTRSSSVVYQSPPTSPIGGPDYRDTTREDDTYSITRNDIAATRCFCCTNTLQNRILNTETSPFLVPFTNDATHKVFVLGGDFSLGEIRLVTNPATKLKVYMPVVGQPRPDFQEKYVDHESLRKNLATYVLPPNLAAQRSAILNTPDKNSARTTDGSTGIRHLEILHHIQCYPDGVLLSPTNLDLDQCTLPTNYVLPHSALAKKFSKCYYVGQNVYDRFVKSKRSASVFNDVEACHDTATDERITRRNRADTEESQDIEPDEIRSAPSDMALGDVRVQMNLIAPGEGGSGGADVYLQCRVVEGKKLKAMDLNGYSDPYCILYVVDDEGEKIPGIPTFRTPTVAKTLNPYWNSLFNIGKDIDVRVDDFTLVIEVYDEDYLTADDHLGMIKIPLWNIPRRWGKQPALDLWVPLHPGKAWIVGELQHAFKGVVENETVQYMCNYTQRHTINHLESSLAVLGGKWRKNVVNDYYMPESVAGTLGAFVERVWVELQMQIMQVVKGVLHVHTLDKYEDAAIHNAVICCSCTNRITAWYRYHMEPFDKTAWGRMRDPVRALLTLLSLIPYTGFQAILFSLKLLCIERKDDFQCIAFIESFKGLQFAQGMFLIVRGVVKYMQCAGLEETGGHTCNEDGPGILNEGNNYICSTFGNTFCFWMSLGEFLFKMLLVYVCERNAYLAYFYLANSVSLGGKVFIDHRLEGAEISLGSDPRQAGAAYERRKSSGMSWMRRTQRRMRITATIEKFDKETGKHTLVYHFERDSLKKMGLTNWPRHAKNLETCEFKMLKLPGVPNNVMNFLFWYDVCIFVAMGGIGGYTIWKYGKTNWMTFGVIYWCKAMYQTFSFPFLVLKVPGLKVLLTHAKKTGYKPNGTLVLFKKRVKY